MIINQTNIYDKLFKILKIVMVVWLDVIIEYQTVFEMFIESVRII